MRDPVRLETSGAIVCSYTEPWRAECEAKHCLEMFPIEYRREHISLIEKRRGRQAADNLRADIMLLYLARDNPGMPLAKLGEMAQKMADVSLHQTIAARVALQHQHIVDQPK